YPYDITPPQLEFSLEYLADGIQEDYIRRLVDKKSIVKEFVIKDETKLLLNGIEMLE
ncbi:8013_t:CDS:2, partial [Gigaspora rosea]